MTLLDTFFVKKGEIYKAKFDDITVTVTPQGGDLFECEAKSKSGDGYKTHVHGADTAARVAVSIALEVATIDLKSAVDTVDEIQTMVHRIAGS